MPTIKIVLKEPELSAPAAPAPAVNKKPQKTCATCAKKLTLTDFACGKCQVRFCALHRLPEEHACPQMEQCRRDAQAALAAANPQVLGKKIDFI